MKVGSLFTGIGGLDLGLMACGHTISWMCENDKHCCRVLAVRFPGVPIYGDIRELRGQDLPPVDIMCAGWPCPPVSCAGKRKGNADERWLWPEVARLLREARPRWLLGENVAGLRSSGSGREFGEVLRDLALAGYDARWESIRASDVGAPHRRERIFIVANRRGAGAGDQCGAIGDEGWSTLSGRGEGLRQGNGASLPSGLGATGEEGAPVAHRPRRGLGELREPSGGDGQSDGSEQELGNAAGTRWERGEKSNECREKKKSMSISGDEAMADAAGNGSQGSRCGENREPNGQPTCRGRSTDDSGLVADTENGRTLPTEQQGQRDGVEPEGQAIPYSIGFDADPGRHGAGDVCGQRPETADVCGCTEGKLAHPIGPRLEGRPSQRRDDGEEYAPAERGGLPLFPPGPDDREAWEAILKVRPDLAPAIPRMRKPLSRHDADDMAGTGYKYRTLDEAEILAEEGAKRLNPRFVEWLMGFPIGFTGVDGVSRCQRLKMLGNAVVPQCAAMAWRIR